MQELVSSSILLLLLASNQFELSVKQVEKWASELILLNFAVGVKGPLGGHFVVYRKTT
jgi:hypothetical protein